MNELRKNRSVHCAISAIKGQTQVSSTLIRDEICLSADASRTLTVTCGGWHKPTSEMAWRASALSLLLRHRQWLRGRGFSSRFVFFK